MQNIKAHIYKYALRVFVAGAGVGRCERDGVTAPGGTVYEAAK